ncbi:MAG TPA: DUF5908 family protein [Longimicrobiales bacterium]
MPVIVDEVVISVEVTNETSGGSATPPSTTDERQLLIAQCVERVLEILAQKEER